MEEAKNKPTKRERLAKIGKAITEVATALMSTIFSAVVVVILYVLYVLYIPFAVGRALFNRKAIRGFYSDVFYAVDGIGQRIRKREEEDA